MKNYLLFKVGSDKQQSSEFLHVVFSFIYLHLLTETLYNGEFVSGRIQSTVGRKNGIIEILVNINQLFVAKIAHSIRQLLPSKKMVLLTADIDFCSFNEANY